METLQQLQSITIRQELLSELNSNSNFLEKRINEYKEKLNENYCYYLSWVGEQLWIETFMNDHYKAIINELNNNNHSEKEVIEYWINVSENFISQSYNVRENSTGSLHRECSTWKFISHMNLLKELKSIYNNYIN